MAEDFKQTIGSNLPPYVVDQIKSRELLYKRGTAGTLDYTSPMKSTERLIVMNSNSAWVKLRSGVNQGGGVSTVEPSQEPIKVKTLNITDYQNKPQAMYGLGANTSSPIFLPVTAYYKLPMEKVNPGSSDIAENFILTGGILNKEGNKGGISLVGGDSSKAYVNQKSIGVRPMPGITGLKVSSKHTYGTLMEAEVTFNVWSIEELEACEFLYFRPGYTALLEWGHSIYVDNQGSLKTSEASINSVPDKIFFTPNNSKLVEDTIEQIRDSSSGNYEGIFGFVLNFTWSFRADGGYDCSVRIISKGVVLESLKISQTSNSGDTSTPTAEETIESQKTLFHRVLKILKEDTKSTTGLQALSSSLSKEFSLKEELLKGVSEFPLLRRDLYTDSLLTKSQICYIPMKTFLEIFKIAFTLKGGSSTDSLEDIVDIDVDSKSEYLTFPEHYTLDPGVALIPHTPEVSGESSGFLVRSLMGAMESYSNKNGGYKLIKNIMISSKTIEEVLDEIIASTENENLGVYDLLKLILNKVQAAFGNINNFEVWIDNSSRTYRIVDRNFILPADQNNIPTLTLVGKGSTLLDLKVESKISNQVASQVAIAAQGSTGDTLENIEALLHWNLGATDRHYPLKRTSRKSPEAIEKDRKGYFVNMGKLWKYFNGAREDTPSKYDPEEWNSVYTAGCEDINRLYKLRIQNNNANTPAPIPIELHLKFGGIAGFKIGLIFKVDGTNLLPSRYKNYAYIITGIEHEITNNLWTTSIKAQFYPLSPGLNTQGLEGTIKGQESKQPKTPDYRNTFPVEGTYIPSNFKWNNPLNIRFTPATKWQGQLRSESGFVVFDTLENGTRAALKLLRNYYVKDRLNTVEKIITKWAPPSENNTENYIKEVIKRLQTKRGKIERNTIIALPIVVLPELLKAMAIQEQGKTLPADIIPKIITSISFI